MAWRAHTPELKKFLTGFTKPTNDAVTEAAAKVGAWLFGRTIGDGVGASEDPPDEEAFTELKRPEVLPYAAAAAAAGQAPGSAKQLERWSRTVDMVDEQGCIIYDFKYEEDEEDKVAAGRKRALEKENASRPLGKRRAS